MAQKVNVILTSDLPPHVGEEGDVETVQFGYEGGTYEIDLLPSQAKELRDFLRLYVEHSRKTPASRFAAKGKPARSLASRERNDEIRAWANLRGYKVSGRGRIPANIVTEYEDAHS